MISNSKSVHSKDRLYVIYSVECVKIDVLKLIAKYGLDRTIILSYSTPVSPIMWVLRHFLGE